MKKKKITGIEKVCFALGTASLQCFASTRRTKGGNMDNAMGSTAPAADSSMGMSQTVNAVHQF